VVVGLVLAALIDPGIGRDDGTTLAYFTEKD